MSRIRSSSPDPPTSSSSATSPTLPRGSAKVRSLLAIVKREPTRAAGEDGARTRVILVPRFGNSGSIVLVNPRTLECRTVAICQKRIPPVSKVVEEVVETTRIDMDDDDDE